MIYVIFFLCTQWEPTDGTPDAKVPKRHRRELPDRPRMQELQVVQGTSTYAVKIQ